VISLAIIKALNQSSSLTYPKLEEKVPNLRYAIGPVRQTYIETGRHRGRHRQRQANQ
jgi:hypothetical protein